MIRVGFNYLFWGIFKLKLASSFAFCIFKWTSYLTPHLLVQKIQPKVDVTLYVFFRVCVCVGGWGGGGWAMLSYHRAACSFRKEASPPLLLLCCWRGRRKRNKGEKEREGWGEAEQQKWDGEARMLTATDSWASPLCGGFLTTNWHALYKHRSILLTFPLSSLSF